MNKPDFEKLYRAYVDRKEVTWAIKALSELLTERADTEPYSIIRHVNQAEQYLREFRENMCPVQQFSSELTETSQLVHTYFRKYCDSHTTTLIWKFVNESKGMRFWYHFITIVALDLKEMKFTHPSDIDPIDLGDDSDNILYHLIQIWMEDRSNYKSMCMTIKKQITPDDATN